MSELEEMQARVKKLSARATQAKMDLHDLAEELPIDWEKIPEVAARTHEVYSEFLKAKAELKKLKAAD